MLVQHPYFQLLTTLVCCLSPFRPMASSQRPGVWQICGEAASSASKSMEDPLVQQQAAEGAILRAQAAFVAYPLDVLKTQVQSGHPRYNRLSRLPCLLKDYKLKIFRGYPGVGANSFLMGALMFGGYRFFDNFWALYQVPDYWRPAVAGGSIGALCGLAATPLEQVKTIMALQETWLKERKITKRIYSSVHDGAWQAPARLKFYAATPLVIRTALFDSQLFFHNSRLREWVASGGCPSNLQFLVGTLGFMLAGLVAATINYPFDRVKGHMMGRAFQDRIEEILDVGPVQIQNLNSLCTGCLSNPLRMPRSTCFFFFFSFQFASSLPTSLHFPTCFAENPSKKCLCQNIFKTFSWWEDWALLIYCNYIKSYTHKISNI